MNGQPTLDGQGVFGEGTAAGYAAAGAAASGGRGGAGRRQLAGPRYELALSDELFPKVLAAIPRPPERLFVVGNPAELVEGIAIIGARKATPYGLGCARRFGYIAAQHGITVVSGGAYGCDSQAHEAALEAGGKTIVFFGGGCDRPYPARNFKLFQRVVDAGGAVASEQPWDMSPLPWMFRERNRLIAGMAKATLVVEAGLPSGTFSTADEALAANKDVMVVPGAITSPTSAGSNRLLAQGAMPIIDDESFESALFLLFGTMVTPPAGRKEADSGDALLDALRANPMRPDEVLAANLVPESGGACGLARVMVRLAELERDGVVARYPDGRFGPVIKERTPAAHDARRAPVKMARWGRASRETRRKGEGSAL